MTIHDLQAEATRHLLWLANTLQTGPNDPLIQKIVLKLLARYAREYEAKAETANVLQQTNEITTELTSALCAKRPFTSARILALASSPIELLPAVEGKMHKLAL